MTDDTLNAKITRLAKAAAAADAEEGGHRVGANVAALIAWSGRVRIAHQGCGPIRVVKDATGYAIGAVCPVHGQCEDAPVWEPPEPR